MKKVSILLCTYNAAGYLQEAIDSILQQTYKNLELIIVDDGSTDGSSKLIRAYNDKRIKYIRRKHNYIASLNAGLKVCNGDYIARMDADDIALPDRIKKQVELLNRRKDIDICFTWGYTFGVIEQVIGQQAKEDIPNILFWLLTGNFLLHPTTMVRKCFMEQHHLKYKSYPYAEDYKLWSDIANHDGKFYVIPEPLFKYRVYESQVSCKHHTEQNHSRLLVQQDIVEHLIARINDYRQQLIKQTYNNFLQLNHENLIQGDEVIIAMFKILRRTQIFV